MDTTTPTTTDPTTTHPTTTHEAFQRAAVKALVQLARTKRALIVDDIWAALPEGTPMPADPRAMSGIISGAVKAGTLRATRTVRKSPRRRSYTKVWKSLLFGK